MHDNKLHIQYKHPAVRRRPVDELLAGLLLQRFGNRQVPVLLAVGGPGGTGKSTFSRDLADKLGTAAVIRLDDYKTERNIRQKKNVLGPHPAANRIDLLCKNLDQLKRGEETRKPVYNKITGIPDRMETLKPEKFIILDGEISTYREFRHLIDFAVFIDSDWKTQLNTRITRDIEQRNYSREKAIATFLQSNLREFEEYGAESKSWADVHLYCGADYRLTIEAVDAGLFDELQEFVYAELECIDLSGLTVPVLTPFEAGGAIDQPAFIRHLEFLAEKGVRRVLVNGTTGEFFSLSAAERRLLLVLARRYFPGVVMFHAGSDSLTQAIEEVKWAEDYGSDAILALPPYYFAAAPREGIITFFQKLAEQTSLPFILYNFPLHTGNPLDMEILSAVKHFGLKDSGGDFSLMHPTTHYYVTEARRITEGYKAGAYGFFCGTANAEPELFVAIEQALRGRSENAADLQQQIDCLEDKFSSGADFIGAFKIATAAKLPDYPVTVRLPLINAAGSALSVESPNGAS